MSLRKAIASLVLVLCLSGTAFGAQLTKRARFQFAAYNAPTLSIQCSTLSNYYGSVLVRTNTCTRIWASSSIFYRYETDCNGRRINSLYDYAPSRISYAWAFERRCKPNARGNRFRFTRSGTQRPNYVNFIAESHRGGYQFYFHVRPEGFECDDDAGWYRANAYVYVCTLPVRDPALPRVICLD